MNDTKTISRQLRWQRAKVAAGCCQRCGKPREHPDLRTLCLNCLEVTRDKHYTRSKHHKTYDCLSRRIRQELSATRPPPP